MLIDEAHNLLDTISSIHSVYVTGAQVGGADGCVLVGKTLFVCRCRLLIPSLHNMWRNTSVYCVYNVHMCVECLL